jgi:RecA-family ATPase
MALISVLAGPPGLGKTTLAVDLAAHVTRGDLPGDIDDPASVLYVSAEDVDSILASRLVAAGGDRERFLVLEAGAGLKLPDHAAALADTAVSKGAKLIVIDPWSAFSTGDSHIEAEVRQAMAPMHAALAEQEIAVLLVMHLNKSNAADLIRRVSGSVAHTAAPRSALLWARDPSDSERGPLRVLAHGKCNVGPEQPSQAWRMTTERGVLDGRDRSHRQADSRALGGLPPVTRGGLAV